MARQRRDKPTWELYVRGEQRHSLEADLLAQIVVILGRQLAHETLAQIDGSAPAPDADGEAVS